MKTSIVFFGTQEFGENILKCLLSDDAFEIKAIVTQPDRPIGREQVMSASPVKILAEKYNLAVLQPASLKNFTDLPKTDYFIVCQYGLIIPQAILDIPKNGTINVHTSLLPKYRGASPIQTALINGETVTGITIMSMDAKMDHGDILSQEKVLIASDDNYLSLSEKMMPIAQKLLLDTLKKLLKKQLEPIPQDESKATYCKVFERSVGQIDFGRSALEIYNLFRGLFAWPGIFTFWQNKRLKFLNIKQSSVKLAPGLVLVEDGKIFVGTQEGALEVLDLQLEGKKPQTAEAFTNGYKNFNGSKLPS